MCEDLCMWDFNPHIGCVLQRSWEKRDKKLLDEVESLHKNNKYTPSKEEEPPAAVLASSNHKLQGIHSKIMKEEKEGPLESCSFLSQETKTLPSNPSTVQFPRPE